MAGKRKKPKTEAPPAPTARAAPAAKPSSARPLLGVALKSAVAVAVIVAVVSGIVRVGDYAGRQVASRDRYAVPFADIACDPPPGLDRSTFLSEARHLADAPETIQTVDPDLGAKLTAVFARHPWVADVSGVEVTPAGQVRVGLKFRAPAMAVSVVGETDPRTVDGGGVLLPRLPPPPADLPHLTSERPAPKTGDGQVWEDAVVRRATDLAVNYKPRRVEKTEKGWRLTQPDGRTLVVGY